MYQVLPSGFLEQQSEDTKQGGQGEASTRSVSSEICQDGRHLWIIAYTIVHCGSLYFWPLCTMVCEALFVQIFCRRMGIIMVCAYTLTLDCWVCVIFFPRLVTPMVLCMILHMVLGYDGIYPLVFSRSGQGNYGYVLIQG